MTAPRELRTDPSRRPAPSAGRLPLCPPSQGPSASSLLSSRALHSALTFPVSWSLSYFFPRFSPFLLLVDFLKLDLTTWMCVWGEGLGINQAAQGMQKVADSWPKLESLRLGVGVSTTTRQILLWPLGGAPCSPAMLSRSLASPPIYPHFTDEKIKVQRGD